MVAVLGVSALYHDAAAALVVDGKIVAAIQEERLSRMKNDPSLPERAMQACLDLAGLEPGALDAVVFYENPYTKLERVLVSLLRVFPRSLRQFPRAVGAQLGGKLWVLDRLSDLLDVPRRRIEHAEHHRSHAASAFFTSPFEHAAVLVVDAVGEHASTSVWRGQGRTLACLGTIEFPHSLGMFYAAMTAYLGFEVNEGEYKVMGLAAFGQPRFAGELARVIQLAGDGSFALHLPYFAHMSDSELGFGPALDALLGPRRPPARPWDLATEEDRRYADIAASVQAVTEDALLGLARRAQALTGARALCLAGGVALNAVANARLLAESGFDRLYVHPAAGDAGGALGAAILGALEHGDERPAALETAALGQAADAARARALAEELGLRWRVVDDVPSELAAKLAAGKIAALATGRFEWGPRALGQRSILAAPGQPEMRERINRVVKEREPFRPFAPSVLAERASAYFEHAPSDMTPFMTTVCPVRPERRGELGAVTHVDGSARVQTVTAGSAPVLHALLGHVEAQTGLPVVLNTSLNGRGDPICGSADDALGFFIGHPVDVLVVDDVIIEKGKPA
jgi:carbamoyltransferase